MKHFHYGLAALLAFAIGSANATVVTANAVTDFATTQGNNGWYYGFALNSNTSYNPTAFQAFTYKNNIMGYNNLNGWASDNTSHAMITPVQGQDVLHWHPSNEAKTILRYDIATAGQLNTQFTIGRLNPHPAGNVNALVYLNGQQIASQLGIQQGQSFTGQWQASVKVGDKLDFVLDANGIDHSDGSSLQANVTIAPVPEPETYALMGMGLLGLLAARRRKTK